ncbi:MAG: hypothetical protein QUS35_02200, partial [bacterium]|nr:hypothetical protein [bacterium]
MKRLALAFLISLGVHILAFSTVFRMRTTEPVLIDEPSLSLYTELEVIPEGSLAVSAARQGRSDPGPCLLYTSDA